MTEHEVLDGFAGSGVGVALKRMGVPERGIEIMPEACATRELHGMETIYNDIWDFGAQTPDSDTHWMSPPCPTFSIAGKGEGRMALNLVLGAIRDRWSSIEDLRAKTEPFGDPRTGLVLTPLHYALWKRPAYIALEQVPPALPVWEAMAEVLEEAAYSTWTGVLNAEQYGVPQTRRRAILIARRDGLPARPPIPSHSRYYNRDPERLDPGVKKWVSMAEAVGWRVGDWGMRSNYGSGGDPAARGVRDSTAPAATITSKADRNRWVMERHRGAGMLERHGSRSGRPVSEPALTVTGNASGTTPGGFRLALEDEEASVPLTIDDAALLQSYDGDFQFVGNKGKQFLQVGNAVPPLLAQAIFEELWK